MLKTAKTTVLASGFWRLKAPRWHLGALWVSDPRAGKIYRIDLDGKVTVVADVPSRPFGLGFLPDGDLLVASMTQRLILNLGGQKAAVHADLADAAVGYLRDMAVARDGNAYVTSFDADAAGPDGFAGTACCAPAANATHPSTRVSHANFPVLTVTLVTFGPGVDAFRMRQSADVCHPCLTVPVGRCCPGLCRSLLFPS